MNVSRRKLMTLAAASAALARPAFANTPTEITWDDLIPPGVPYSEIIGEGVMDERNDLWHPVFDANATKLNPALDGAYIKMPGFIIPIDLVTQRRMPASERKAHSSGFLHVCARRRVPMLFLQSSHPTSQDSVFRFPPVRRGPVLPIVLNFSCVQLSLTRSASSGHLPYS